jgi:hypothetical protein
MEGLLGGGGPFWLLRETMTFIGHAAYQNTVVIQTGMNKILPNFKTLSATSLHVLWLFKWFTAQRN